MTTVFEAAASLGLEVITQHPCPTLGPCPACHDRTRHRKSGDKRGALSVTPDGRGWHCFQCGAGGNAQDLLRAAGGLVRKSPPRAHATSEASSRVTESEGEGHKTPPPIAEVLGLWEYAKPVVSDPEAMQWFDARKIDAEWVWHGNLARVVPRKCGLPRWAGKVGDNGRWFSWPSMGLRLLVPLFDEVGEMRSVTFRSLAITSKPGRPKSLPPTGHSRRGLVMADGLSRQLLQTGAVPAWWDGGPRLRVVIAEGEPDFLTWTTERCHAADAYAPAVFGIVSGAWTRQVAQRIPDGALVIAATDPDEQGDKYAATILASLAGRSIGVRRWQ